jgi:FKBP-type peptidyl-prolyl cis-trans isomerase SlpA
MQIENNSIVTMHFDIRLKDGSIADSTRNVGRPMQFTMGKGVFSDKLETELLGLKAGDKKKIMLLPHDAFGDPHPANIYEFPKHKFASFELEEGLIIGFTQKDGSELPGIVRQINDNEVTIDFNHPLSGQVVLFDLEIIAVE